MIRTNGFTLIELLVAMVAGSLLLITLGWTVGSLGSEARLGGDERQAIDLARLAPTLDRLASAIIPGDGALGKLHLRPDELTARIAPPEALGAIGPVQMSLAVEREAEGEALILRLSASPPSGEVPPRALEPLRLAYGFRSIGFSREERHHAENAAPITLTFVGDDDEQRTLTMVPRVTTSGACRFDPISMACR